MSDQDSDQSAPSHFEIPTELNLARERSDEGAKFGVQKSYSDIGPVKFGVQKSYSDIGPVIPNSASLSRQQSSDSAQPIRSFDNEVQKHRSLPSGHFSAPGSGRQRGTLNPFGNAGNCYFNFRFKFPNLVTEHCQWFFVS